MVAEAVSGGEDDAPARDHFQRLVKTWSQFGPPLRPSPEDSAVVQRLVDGLPAGARAVLLGLTPEIVACRWPRSAQLTAVDHSEGMVRMLWRPEAAPPGARAVIGDWRNLPFEPESVDFVVGDAVTALMPFPGGWHDFVREVRRVLKPSGRFVMRAFLRPQQAESAEAIGAALERDEVETIHALKLRLLAAVHGRSGTGSRLGDAWELWKTMPAPGRLGSPGWTEGELESMEAYRGMDTRYYLATHGELVDVYAPAFVAIESVAGRHSIGDRCPTLVFRRS
jgi:SAM-dependent methyltransferase